MAKATKVKWALGSDEPEDLQDFLTNDDIVAKHTNKKTKDIDWPGKGPFKFSIRFLRVKPNRNGDDRISALLVINDKKIKDWNGYAIFDGFNVTEQGAPFLKRFLKALGLSWADFIDKSKQEKDGDNVSLVQIGRVKFNGAKDVTVMATVKVKPADDFNDDEHLEIGRYIPLDDEEPEDEDEDDVDEDEDDDDFMEDEDEEDEEDEDDEDEDDDEEDEEEEEDDEDEEDEDVADEDEIEELRSELKSETIAKLRKRALRNDKKADIDGLKKKGLVDLILSQELNMPPF